MTIEKGRSWGEPWSDPAPLPAATDDAALAALAHRALADGSPLVATVATGDLLATLGLSGPRPPEDRHGYPIDLGLAHLGPGPEEPPAVSLPFVAHVTVRGPRLTGIGPGVVVAAMNAAWLDDLRLGPKAHPNDGLLDITEGRIGVRQRREATARARTGAHLPHPRLTTTRRATWRRSFRRPVPVWVDGVRCGRFRSIELAVVPDGLVVVA